MRWWGCLSSVYGERALSWRPVRAGAPAGQAEAAGGDAGGMPWFAAALARAQGGFDPMGAWYAYHMGQQQALAKGAGQHGAAGFGGGAAGVPPTPGSAAGVCRDAPDLGILLMAVLAGQHCMTVLGVCVLQGSRRRWAVGSGKCPCEQVLSTLSFLAFGSTGRAGCCMKLTRLSPLAFSSLRPRV